MYIPLPSPRTFKWDGVEFYQSPNLQQLQHFAVLLALHGLCKSAGILSHKDYFKMRWMVFMLLCLKLNRMEHAPLLKEINHFGFRYACVGEECKGRF